MPQTISFNLNGGPITVRVALRNDLGLQGRDSGFVQAHLIQHA